VLMVMVSVVTPVLHTWDVYPVGEASVIPDKEAHAVVSLCVYVVSGAVTDIYILSFTVHIGWKEISSRQKSL